jgi:hypothetical protein
MRPRRSAGPPEAVDAIELGGCLPIRPGPQTLEASAPRLAGYRFEQGRADPVSADGRRNVQVPHSGDVGTVGIRVDVESTDADHLAFHLSDEQSFTWCIETVGPGLPFRRKSRDERMAFAFCERRQLVDLVNRLGFPDTRLERSHAGEFPRSD